MKLEYNTTSNYVNQVLDSDEDIKPVTDGKLTAENLKKLNAHN